MKVKCSGCDRLIDVPISEPALDKNGAFWWRFILLVIPLLALILLSLIGWGVFNSYRAKTEFEALLQNPSVKVDIQELQNGQQIRKFTR